MRHTGRDHGDLVIRLIDQTEDAGSPRRVQEIPVPVGLDDLHPTVLQIGESGQLLDVTPEHRNRALRILQAVADECVRRASARPNSTPTFRIGTGQDLYDFALIEEYEKRPVLDSEVAAAAKYPWQRIPSTVKDVRQGRLRITLEYGHPHKYWADRHRWRLDSRLPSLFAQIEDLTVAAAAHRAEAEERRIRQTIEKEERLQSWRIHVEKARLAYVENLNRRRLEDQVLAAALALSIRDYAARMLGLLDQEGTPDTAVAVREWAQWALAEAERIDPLTQPEHLVFTVPDDVDPAELDRFMPKGLTARNPPS